MAAGLHRGHLPWAPHVADVEDAEAPEPLLAHRLRHSLQPAVEPAPGLLDRHDEQVADDRDVALGDPDGAGNVYVYGSGTASVRSGDELEGCSDESPAENPDTALFRIDVIQIPLANPEEARVVSRPFVFRDPETGDVAGLWRGGDHGPGTQRTSETSRCHDITAYLEIGLAAGACSGNGILLDISDPLNPVRIDEVVDPGFAYWHSATFNNDGTKVLFTDEWGGGGRARCRASDPRQWGANAIYDIVDGQLEYRSHYKLPAPQGETENWSRTTARWCRCPAATSWCRAGIRVASRSSTSPTWSTRSRSRTSTVARSTPTGS